MRRDPDEGRPEWHYLLGPLPDDAIPDRSPVGSPEVLATPDGAAIAGWEQLVLDLSAGRAGGRVLLVVLDGAGEPISAGDSVLYRAEAVRPDGGSDPAAPADLRYESIGGRFDPERGFRGTWWRMVGVEPPDGQDVEWDTERREPSAEEVAALTALTAELRRRQPPRD